MASTKRIRDLTIGPLLLILCGMQIVQLALAGSEQRHHANNVSSLEGFNLIVREVCGYAMISGSIGLTSALAALHHLLVWRPESRAAYAATALVDISLSLIALGYSCKNIHNGMLAAQDKLLIQFVLVMSRQGKIRLSKWYTPYSQKERAKIVREVSNLFINRGQRLCNFVEWQNYRIVYKRFASLFFAMCVDLGDNELETLEIIQHYVEILDRYFGNVCELDLIFHFHKAYYVLDEVLLAGELQEPSRKSVARVMAAQDEAVEQAKTEATSITSMIANAVKSS